MTEIKTLRRLIAQYQERLSEGATSDMVVSCIQAIRDAERKIVEIESRSQSSVPSAGPADSRVFLRY